jgi:hypothetical protein
VISASTDAGITASSHPSGGLREHRPYDAESMRTVQATARTSVAVRCLCECRCYIGIEARLMGSGYKPDTSTQTDLYYNHRAARPGASWLTLVTTPWQHPDASLPSLPGSTGAADRRPARMSLCCSPATYAPPASADVSSHLPKSSAFTEVTTLKSSARSGCG